MARLLVLGGDAAGMSAATHVRREVPGTEIVVIERGPYTSYSACGIPYVVSGEVPGIDDLVARSPEAFRESGITVHLHTEALAIDPDRRTVRVRDLDAPDEHGERDEPYDVLLYGLGAHPTLPDVPGVAEYGLPLRTLDEGERLRDRLDELMQYKDTPEHPRVVVVGAGYIGMEMAEALIRRGFESVLLDRSPQVMKPLDPDLAAVVEQVLVDFGVRVCLNESLVEVRGADGRCKEVVTDSASGEGTYPADLVVVASGSRPNVEVAQTAGCKLGETGALWVDERLRTSVDGIWAAGDCVESVNLVDGHRRNVQLGTHANKQGRTAGIDIAAVLQGRERGDAAFDGHVGTAITKVCHWEIARTGLNEDEARRSGLDFAEVTFQGTATAGYMPEPGVVHVRMLAEAGTGRMLGAQLVGTCNIGKQIDVAATWCQLGVTVQQAQFLDLAYAPPFGGVWDLLQVAARKLVKKLDLSPQL